MAPALTGPLLGGPLLADIISRMGVAAAAHGVGGTAYAAAYDNSTSLTSALPRLLLVSAHYNVLMALLAGALFSTRALRRLRRPRVCAPSGSRRRACAGWWACWSPGSRHHRQRARRYAPVWRTGVASQTRHPGPARFGGRAPVARPAFAPRTLRPRWQPDLRGQAGGGRTRAGVNDSRGLIKSGPLRARAVPPGTHFRSPRGQVTPTTTRRHQTGRCWARRRAARWRWPQP